MKKYSLLLFVIPILFFIDNKTQLKVSVQNKTESNESHNEIDDWLYAQKTFPYSKTDKQAQRNAVEFAMAKKSFNKTLKLQGDAEDDWHFLGPISIGGRILDIECPIDNDNTIYVGTASGGVLKTYNRGNTWQSIFDDNATLSIGDIAIDPIDTNIIYVGTGEPGNGVGSVTYDGNGIYKSTNGGDTWTNIGLVDGGNTGRIAINPNNPQILFAAMLGDLFENNSERGIYRSENGGDTWENVLYLNDSTGGIDVTINPDNPNIIYASTWERIRRYNLKRYYGMGSRIYKSIDGGDTWEMLTNGLPNTALSKITLAIAPTNPNIIYAAIVGSDDKLKDIYKSTNGGDSWIGLNASSEVGAIAQDYWYGGIRVNPNNENKIYWVGFNCYRSNDGGENWAILAPYAHVDCHAFYMSPTNENYKIMGGDGGLFFTENDFNTYTTEQNIPVTQLYTLNLYPGDTSRLIAGAQDNNCFIKNTAGSWYYVNGGDGVSAKFIPSEIESYYANFQYGGYYGLIDGVNQPLIGFDYDDRHNWRSPIELNPLNEKTIYFGGSKLQRSTNYGSNLNTISNDLSNGDQGIGLTFGTIFTIHNAIADTNYIYVGTDDANIWRSKNYGATWTKITDGLPYRYCMSIETDPEDAEIVYVTFSGFRWADATAHIYKSIDAGTTWLPIDGDIPDIPINDIQVSKNNDTTLLMIATDVGCYYSYNNGSNWHAVGTSMPIISVYEIEYDKATNTLFAATYGRGVWKIALPKETPLVSINDINTFECKLFPNPCTDYIYLTSTSLFIQAIINIFSLQGALVFTTNVASTNTVKINTNHLSSGVYLVEVNMNGKKKFTKMIKN